jgi:hypothetical protein
MSIDYEKVLEKPEVLAWAKAACPDYQDNVDSEGSNTGSGRTLCWGVTKNDRKARI